MMTAPRLRFRTWLGGGLAWSVVTRLSHLLVKSRFPVFGMKSTEPDIPYFCWSFGLRLLPEVVCTTLYLAHRVDFWFAC